MSNLWPTITFQLNLTSPLYNSWSLPGQLQTESIASGAANFASASMQYLSVANNSSLQTGNIDWWVSCWFKTTQRAGEYPTFVSKTSSAGGSGFEFELWLNGDDGKANFFITPIYPANNVESVAIYNDGQWHFAIGWVDVINNTMNLSVDNNIPVSTTPTIPITASNAPFAIGADFQNLPVGNFTNGQIDTVLFGKSPPGGIAGVIEAIRSTVWNFGNGLSAKSLTTTQKTTWGVISGWDFDNSLNLGADSIDSNNLTNNNGVSFANGKIITETNYSNITSIPTTFSSWIPSNLPGPNIKQLNAYTFIAYGKQASYLKKTYANGGINDLLTIIS